MIRFDFVCAMLVMLLGLSSGASFAQKSPEFPPDFPHESVYYYNGVQRVEMNLALDELRVSGGLGVQLSGFGVASLANARQGVEELGGSVLVRYDRAAGSAVGLHELAKPVRGAGGDVAAVMYGANVSSRSEAQPVGLTNEFSLKLKPGVSLESVLQAYSLDIVDFVVSSPDTYIVRSRSEDLSAGLRTANALYEDGLAEFATPLLQHFRATRFIPNDSLFGSQWHLRNTDQFGGSTTAGNDVNITGAWDSFDGTGVNIAITDTGVEVAHADISPNARTDIDIDLNGGDNDPTPSFDDHGTAAAGIAAAQGHNAIGVTGAAFNAGIVGIRLIEGATNDNLEAQAMEHQVAPANANDRVHINSNSWGPFDDGVRKETFGPLTDAALDNGIQNGRGGKGTIYVWAAGNGRTDSDNVNYDGYASDRRTIAVGASTGNGVFSSYSEPGASMLVTAPSSGGGIGTTTTTTGGGYISDFGGTSSAAPLAAGVIALMLEANPNLGWREVQHILVDTSTQIHAAGGGWATNGAGRPFSHNYGFGRVDAGAAVAAAQEWGDLPASAATLTNFEIPFVEIPDNNPNGLTRTVSLSDPAGDFIIEHVEVIFTANHTFRGDLQVTLTSPAGTQSVLAEGHDDNNDNYSDWMFTSVAHWGESPAGIWTLHVADLFPNDTGTLIGWRVTVHGYRPDTSVVWADANHTGMELGEQGRPYDTFTEAVSTVDSGGTVMLKASNFDATGTFSKNMRIESSGGSARIGQ